MKNKRGFTLVELLVVVAIIVILTIVFMPNVLKAFDYAKKKSFITDANVIFNKSMDEIVTDSLSNKKNLFYSSGNNPLDLSIDEDYCVSISNNNGSVNTITVYNDEYYITSDNKEGLKIENIKEYSSKLDVSCGEIINLDSNCFTYFETDDGGIAISGWNSAAVNSDNLKCSGSRVKITDTINGKPVVKITNRAFQNAKPQISELYLPNSIKEIDIYSFKNTGLTKVSSYNSLDEVKEYTFPKNLESINWFAFANNNLTKVYFEDNIKIIENASFATNKIQDFNLPNSITTLSGAAFLNNLLPDDKAFIFRRESDGTVNKKILIGYCGAKKDGIEIPDGVEQITGWAFSSSNLEGYGLKTKTIDNEVYYDVPDSLEQIDTMSFANNQITILAKFENAKMKYGGGIFNNNNNVSDNPFFYSDQTTLNSYANRNVPTINGKRTIKIPNNVEEISNMAFSSIVFDILEFEEGSKLKRIGNYAFLSSQLEEIQNLPLDSIVEIGYGAFTKNNIKYNGVEQVGMCEAKIKGSNKLKFFFCSNVPNDIDIDTNTIKITSSIVNNFGKDSINIPNNVKIIGEHSFNYNAPRTLRIPEGIEVIEESAFDESSIETIYIPSSVKKIYKNAFRFSKIENVYIYGKSSSSEFEQYGDNIYTFTGKKNCKDYKSESASKNNGIEYSDSCVHWNYNN